MWIYTRTVIIPGVFWFFTGAIAGYIFALATIMVFEPRSFELSGEYFVWTFNTAGPYFLFTCSYVGGFLMLSKRWALKEFLDQRITVFNTIHDYNQRKVALNQEINTLKAEIYKLKAENAKITKERDKLEIIIDDNFRTKKD